MVAVTVPTPRPGAPTARTSPGSCGSAAASARARSPTRARAGRIAPVPAWRSPPQPATAPGTSDRATAAGGAPRRLYPPFAVSRRHRTADGLEIRAKQGAWSRRTRCPYDNEGRSASPSRNRPELDSSTPQCGGGGGASEEPFG